jgi:hypothetical protein
MPPRRRSPRRPTRRIITTEDVENDDEAHLWHRNPEAARVVLNAEVPSLPPPPADQSSRVATPSFALASEIATLTLVPTADSALSNEARGDEAAPTLSTKFNWAAVNWGNLPGHSIPVTRNVVGLSSKMWQFGVPTEEQDSGHRFWLCNECHSVDAEDSHHFNIESGSSSVTKHLRNVHKITGPGKAQ